MNSVAHKAAVDEVERLMVCPLILHIVDFETDVWGNPTVVMSWSPVGLKSHYPGLI